MRCPVDTAPTDPADFLRDLFQANEGRISSSVVDAALEPQTFTYGSALGAAWHDLMGAGTIKRDGSDWVWTPPAGGA